MNGTSKRGAYKDYEMNKEILDSLSWSKEQLKAISMSKRKKKEANEVEFMELQI